MNPSGADCRIVIVSHDSDATLAECARLALAQQALAVELVVVDNASRVDPQVSLPSDPRLRLIRNPHNPGFARACNQGAEGCGAAYLLFLNPDCYLPVDGLRRLIDRLAARPEIGLLGAQLLNADGSLQSASRRSTPTPLRVLTGAVHSRSAPNASAADLRWEPVDAVSGALMLLPTAVFVELGGFDEAYRLHCEDLDLCRRVLASGRSVAIADDVRVVHVKGTSSRRRPVWVEWQKHRGMWRYFSKFDRASTPAWLTLLLAVGLCLRFPLAALRAWWQARTATR